MSFREGRRDLNEQPVVAALRRVSLHVYRIRKSDPAGCPDLFVWSRGRWIGLELKNPKGRNTLSIEQQRLADLGAVQVVRSVDEALKAIGAIA